VKLRQNIAPKQQISSVTRGWLPILQAGLGELKEAIEKASINNPFISVKDPNEIASSNSKDIKRYYFEKGFIGSNKASIKDSIETLNAREVSLYEELDSQITSTLFPTPKSKEIAYKIIEKINCEGYFEGEVEDIADELKVEASEVERIRQRFAYLEPVGVGARDYKEAFLFQLDDMDIKDEKLYQFIKKIILNFENYEKYHKNKLFKKAFEIIKKFKNPPAIEFFEDSGEVIPDIIVNVNQNDISVKLNSEYYPDLEFDFDGVDDRFEFVKKRVREAKDLNDALNMRKSTLYDLGLMLVEYQYDYFMGGSINPMRIVEIAEELGRAPSTISRAISNKYLASNRGIIALKEFFATALDEDTSNAKIRDLVAEIIKNEPRKKPYSDQKILEIVERKLNVKMVRRTINKYRLQLGIGSSAQRKKEYMVGSR
jgi:RNA polymerase sigma-54 factor